MSISCACSDIRIYKGRAFVAFSLNGSLSTSNVKGSLMNSVLTLKGNRKELPAKGLKIVASVGSSTVTIPNASVVSCNKLGNPDGTMVYVTQLRSDNLPDTNHPEDEEE